MALLAQEMGFFIERFDDFKRQTAEDFAELKSNTSGNYASKSTVDDHERRLAKLEGYLMKFLLGVTALVGLAVFGLLGLRR